MKDFPEKINIGATEYTFNLPDALYINESDLNYEYCRQAELFAQYATAYEIAVREVRLKKAELDKVCAHLDRAGRQEMLAAGVKFTEKMVEHFVKGHNEYFEKNKELVEAETLAGLLKEAKDAMLQKQYMLVQLGSTQRQERGSDISMKADYVQGNNFST